MRFHCTSTGPIGGLNCEVLLYFNWSHIGGLNCAVLLYFNWSHRSSQLCGSTEFQLVPYT